jgi:hypothetical protein
LNSSPFALRIQARVTLGADPMTQALAAQVVYSRNRLQDEDLRARTLATWRNVPAEVLAFDRDHPLGLGAGQVAALNAAASRVSAKADSLATEVSDVISMMGLGTDRAQVSKALAHQAVLLREAQALLDDGRTSAQVVVGDDKWRGLPGRVRAAVRATVPASPAGGIQLLPDF